MDCSVTSISTLFREPLPIFRYPFALPFLMERDTKIWVKALASSHVNYHIVSPRYLVPPCCQSGVKMIPVEANHHYYLPSYLSKGRLVSRRTSYSIGVHAETK
jgi:hypothetical protein